MSGAKPRNVQARGALETGGQRVQDALGVVEAIPKALLVDGVWRQADSARSFAVEDPATGGLLADVPDADVDDGLAALEAAAKRQSDWASTPARARSELLRRVFEEVIDHRDDLALVITAEAGKPLREAQAEVDYGAEFLRWFSEQTGTIAGRYADDPGGSGRIVTRRQAVGPCLLVTPWNFPLAMATRKIAPALAAGCTAVVKPAPQTPLTTLYLAELFESAGLPPGVLNVVTTSNPGPLVDAVISDGRARKLSFTGSTEVGRQLLAKCGDKVMRTSMELGGNAPLLVFDDADLVRAVEGAAVAKLRNAGQSCVAANRIYVQSGIADEFTEAFVGRIRDMRVGPGLEDVDLGPLIDKTSRQRVASLVGDAEAKGARVLLGGQALEGRGYFFAATVVDELTPDARVLHEEIFGPVASLIRFEDESEAVAAANATDYGLVAYVFTQDLDRALRLSDCLDTGMVGINQGLVSNAAAPFGGVKQSGIGREGGAEGLEEYLSTKYIGIAGATGR